jgi:2-polyprenyl-3-methyl-5-hydroxy-6-metoxy-1,4-benzoquinol methylase
MKTADCILCRSDKGSTVHDLKDYSYVRCSGCGLVSLHPMPGRAALMEIYSGADERAVDPATDPTGEESLFLARFGEELDRIEKHASRGRILDIGSAWGFFLHVCRERGWDAWGVDPARVESEYARRRFGLPIVTGTLADARFPSESFDVVTLWHVLEHFPDPVTELGAIRRILKPGGLLVISVPTAHALEDFDYGPIPLHCWYFGQATLLALVEREGFRVVRVVAAGGTGAVRTLKKLGVRNPARTLVRHYRVLHWVRKAARAVLNLVGPRKEITLYARASDHGRGT